MSAAALAEQVARATGRRTLLAAASLDEAVDAALSHPAPIMLAVAPTAPQLAALGAAARIGGSVVLAGTLPELERHAAAMAAAVGPGRLVLARDWALDPTAAILGRRGAALLEAEAPARPRSRGESPCPVPEGVRAAIVRAASEEELQRYPPPTAERLEHALSLAIGADSASVVVSGGGSLELLQRVLRTFTDPGDEVLARAPTFDGLPSLCRQEGLALRLGDPRAPSPATRVVYLATPNNPDSARLQEGELQRIRASVARDRVVIVDEAWHGFAGEETAYWQECREDAGPVVVLRSFSKVEGLAGLRVGYAVASAPVAAMLRRFGLPSNLNVISEAGALAALEDTQRRASVRTAVRQTRLQLVSGLRRLGFETTDSDTHVLLARPPDGTLARLLALAEAQQLPLEECNSLPGWVQLTVPAAQEATRLLRSLEAL